MASQFIIIVDTIETTAAKMLCFAVTTALNSCLPLASLAENYG